MARYVTTPRMDALTTLIPLPLLALCFGITLLAGTVKGMVGFAMPMVMISLMSSVIDPELALAGLILPTVITNATQALRQGWRAALEAMLRFRVFLGVGLVALVISSQLVRVLPQETLLLMIGLPVSVFSALQLMGWQLRLPERGRLWIESALGGIAGFMGGFSGVWGPPTVMYLTALDTPKAEQMRIQGVIYGAGAVVLIFSHLASGVLRAETVPFSLALIVPAVLGMAIGTRLHDRIDQRAFRKATLAVLFIVALNLVRRALM